MQYISLRTIKSSTNRLRQELRITQTQSNQNNAWRSSLLHIDARKAHMKRRVSTAQREQYSSRKVKRRLAKEYLGTGEDEGEVIVEVRKVRVALKVLPNLSLIGGRRMRNLLLEEAADLLEALLLRLPRWSRRRRHRHRNPPPN